MGAPPFFQDYIFIVYVFYVFVKRRNKPPSDLTVSLGGLFFAFPEQIFFVAVHLVLFFFGQALALFASLVRGVDVGQAQQVVGGGAVELADGKQHIAEGVALSLFPRTDRPNGDTKFVRKGLLCVIIQFAEFCQSFPKHSLTTFPYY